MAKTGDDCYFFYYQTCIKGAACPFRHVEEAKSSTVTCDNWRLNRCQALTCPFRHMELQQNTPCYYESQPGGCTKVNCQFQHKFTKQSPGPPVPVSVAPVPGKNVVQQPPVTGPMPGIYNRPPPGLAWPGQGIPPPRMFPGPPVSGPSRPVGPGFPPFYPAGPPPASVRMMQIEPVIINPNEESDQDSIKGSPMKPVSRSVVQPVAPLRGPAPVQSSNPLDYFLNAKPWVEPSQRNVLRRSPSPRRSPPYRKEGSVSPRRSQSPRRSLSPDVSRRRSVSAERYSSSIRRRSGSLDRSRSPEWRDRRRFGRRSSRSPPRRRSRSPDRIRVRTGVLNRFRPESRGQKLQEVKVSGSKIISIKKERKEKEDEEREKEEQEDKKEENIKVKEPSKAAPVIKEEVKSLEDIYRERALQSMMEAKRKKILENKRKRWEKVDSKRKSESDKSGKQSGDDEIQSTTNEDQSAVDEKGDNQNEEVDSSSDSPDDDEDNKSDMDLPDDIDIELGEGELESDREGSEKSEAKSDQEFESHESEEELPEKPNRKTKSSVSVKAKPSIKSRLGIKAVERSPERRVQGRVQISSQKRSVKDRLGIKSSTHLETEKPVRTGVIKLNRKSKADDIMSRIRINRDVRERKHDSKNILMVPQITIKNQFDIEERKAGIKQRLGLLDDEENDSDSKKERRKKRGVDGELMKLLREEDAEIDEEDLELLSKKEKKKLLKRLLAQQGREDEYELIRKRKKRGFKKKKEHIDEEGDRESKRRINIQSRLGRKEEVEDSEDKEEGEAGEDLPSEDEIELEEEIHDTAESSPKKHVVENIESPRKDSEEEDVQEERRVKSVKNTEREREEKEARLREALEPKSLEDIRRERAFKKSQPVDARIKIATGQNKRKIILEEEQQSKPAEPPVRVTFTGMDSAPKRKLIRLGREQNENDQPARGFRRERQIYVPPTVKKTDAPVVATKALGPPKGREIVDYGDMFPKKSFSKEDIGVKKGTVKLITSVSESDLSVRPRLKLQKGPPKVEVKDATVKTFAEIMAEKKRKRLLAQQGRPYKPIAFDDTESSQESKSVSGEDRLSPLPTQSQVTLPSSSISVSSPVKTQTLTKSSSTSNIEQTDNKPNRWKRRKVNNPQELSSKETVTKSQEISTESIKDSKLLKDTKLSEKVEKIDESGYQEELNSQKSSPSPVKRELSISAEESKPSVEKKKKLSDSFLDFDDDLLDDDVGDIDLDIGDNQDPDELMREIDELLS